MEKNDFSADSTGRTVGRRTALKTLGAAAGLSVGLPFVGSSDASAQQERVVVEEFEYGTQQLGNRYQFLDGQQGVSTAQSVSKSGSQSLRINGVDSGVYASSLPEAPTRGDTFSYWVRATGGADTLNFGYAVDDPNNQYYVKLQLPQNSAFLYKEVNGAKSVVAQSNMGFTLGQNNWYRVLVQWQESGRHTVIVVDGAGTPITRFSGMDSQYDSGGVGFYAYLASGGSAFYDSLAKASSSGSGGSNGSSGSNGSNNSTAGSR
ncbi:hypothetical protein [Haloprofundus salilacus]|uniref:hypothetical protein n=1 Tax=Haloprofundus salilacus TaxID=2876190 RepID=UPI001CCCD842|nr:hypothetical protein [Haloprofundus salilacus]